MMTIRPSFGNTSVSLDDTQNKSVAYSWKETDKIKVSVSKKKKFFFS